MRITKKQLEKLIKEAVLREEPSWLDPEDADGQVRKAKVEEVIKRLNNNAFDHPDSLDQSKHQPGRVSWIRGYQKALNEVAEELLDLVF